MVKNIHLDQQNIQYQLMAIILRRVYNLSTRCHRKHLHWMSHLDTSLCFVFYNAQLSPLWSNMFKLTYRLFCFLPESFFDGFSPLGNSRSAVSWLRYGLLCGEENTMDPSGEDRRWVPEVSENLSYGSCSSDVGLNDGSQIVRVWLWVL